MLIKIIIFMMGLVGSNYPMKAEALPAAHSFCNVILISNAMKTEIWKDVIGFEGLYQVSSFGRVKSFYGRTQYLKTPISNVGYYFVSLCRNKNKFQKQVHQLVAESFLNHKICGYKLVVNHKDLNKLNNNVDNLEVVTARQNCNQKHIPHSSKYTGVSFFKASNKWSSQIIVNGKKKHLGYFSKEYDAHLAYEDKLSSLCL